ncbi:MAG: AAA family ATPase [Bacilli bacterium]|nr:AAA family ATPase [Bacilli bacterium]
MYLKSIKADGFKSFADKIDIELTTGITGVVGPNGSGKSNIVDAIRWVLGEQSIKSLRGDGTMTDVIFQGSKSRNALKRASVSLVFDNSDHYLNSDFSEIEVKRIVYNTGENEYLLNNTKVRLKDITDLFIDSGVDKEAFNIISQGEVTNIVNSKPHERRVIFESAASVLKYKKRKEESLRKLEKTKDNLQKIELLINEINETMAPLEEEAKKASKFIELRDKLKDIEIALIVSDITKINNESNILKQELDNLKAKLESMENEDTSDNTLIEELKFQKLNLDDTISTLNEELISLNERIAKVDSEKRLNVERQSSDAGVDSNKLVSLKEEILNINKNITVISNELNLINEDLTKENANLDRLTTDRKNLNIKNNTYAVRKDELNSELFKIKNLISITENNISGDGLLTNSVKKILNNPRLKKHDVFGRLFDYDSIYAKALDCAIGYNYNVLVVDNEEDAKSAINYLKENDLGRATFFPLNIIKPKWIDQDIVERISVVNGFIGIASDLVTYDKQYENIIKNQLGNIIVVKDIDALNLIGRIINYQYRIVSLDGDILNKGGSITGGSAKSNNGKLEEKAKLVNYKNKEQELLANLETLKLEIEANQDDIDVIDTQEKSTLNEIYKYQEMINNKNQTLEDYRYQLNIKESEYNALDSKKDAKLDNVIDQLLKEYYELVEQRDTLVKTINHHKNDLFSLNNQIDECELNIKKHNSTYNALLNDIKNKEVTLAKNGVMLDNLLLNLSDFYSMTYDYALNNFELEKDINVARKEVRSLKLEIKDLGDVNTGSIAEYDRLQTRYQFLNEQKSDLDEAINNLLGIINEMDEIMKTKFLATFEEVKKEFGIVFKELFKGGEGTLKLTDPDNILETGVEILAVPPGKKISSNTLLSGGEKTLTAIALLFAILNVKKAPFCVLDEVEAALDEANVDMFGNFLLKKKDASQFIIITHKKRTMEYADYLYGITMQESGVSKLVSVKLDNLK